MTINTSPSRIASIDILRALTMVLMIFVNDLGPLKDIPEWLEHTRAEEDGMGLADIVFPAFLFIVGMSVPFAIAARRKKGDNDLQIVGHVMMRGIALLVMGVFFVNGEYLNAEATGLSRGAWNTLACIAYILLWNAYPSTANKTLVTAGKVVGVAILLVLAYVCRGGEDENIQGFSTYWWGILGLIGWSYLLCGIAFIYAGKNLTGPVILWAVFSLLCVASHANVFPEKSFITTILSPFGGGAMPALVMGGVVASLIYLYYRNINKHREMMITLVIVGVVLLVMGLGTRPLWGISKIRATPSWIWICSAIPVLTFVLIYWIADLRGKANWFNIIKPAGTSTLLCYLIPYFAYALFDAVKLQLPDVIMTGALGLLKSLTFSLVVVWIAGWLTKLGIQLKL